MSELNETMPKAIKDRVYRKVRRKKLTPTDINLQGRIVPKRDVDHTPIMYKHEKDGNEVKNEEIIVEGGMSDFGKQMAAMKQIIGQYRNLRKQFDDIDRAMQQMDKWLDVTVGTLEKVGKKSVAGGATRTTVGTRF